MRIALGLAFILMVAFAASAAPERTSIGPYNVSFDLNTTLNHTLQEQPAIEMPFYTVYRLLIKTDNSSLAGVAVVEYKNLTDSTLDLASEILRLNMMIQGYYMNTTLTYGKMDEGKEALVITGLNESGASSFHGIYWLDSEKCDCGPVSVGRTNVRISSQYPPEVTASLLNTIHVEKKLQTPAAP